MAKAPGSHAAEEEDRRQDVATVEAVVRVFVAEFDVMAVVALVCHLSHVATVGAAHHPGVGGVECVMPASRAALATSPSATVCDAQRKEQEEEA